MIGLLSLSLILASPQTKTPVYTKEQIDTHVNVVTTVCKSLVVEQARFNTVNSFEKFVRDNKLSPSEQIQLLIECLIYTKGIQFGYDLSQQKPITIASH